LRCDGKKRKKKKRLEQRLHNNLRDSLLYALSPLPSAVPVFPLFNHPPSTMNASGFVKMDQIIPPGSNYEITGPDCQILTINLAPGERVEAEPVRWPPGILI
jgi:hypothetical protein